ncbi:tyrosine phosphatase family-domain-containing protein [Xylaria palmicola]|nr:tyrosine phosphatase family-domain-containing protein [Xylaria palmicola]
MAGSNYISDKPYVAGAKLAKSGSNGNVILQSSEGASHQDAPTQDVLQDSQSCSQHLLLPSLLTTCLSPPVNFSSVSKGLYRSGYPQTQDYPFMQRLQLKTIVTLVKKDLPDGYQTFMEANQIAHKIFDMSGTKKEEIPLEMMRSIHAVVANRNNYPLLIHCNQGKHRTGCVVGVLRKSNHWDVKRIIQEYSAFAQPKVRETDIKYLTEFDPAGLLRQPGDMALTTTVTRYARFIILVILAMFALSPLGKFKVEKPHPKST